MRYSRLIAFFMLLGPLAAEAQEAAPKWPIPEGLKWASINSYPMAYQDLGSGDPMVLVHGSTSDYRIWSSNVEELSKKHRLIVVSLRHFFPESWDGTGGNFSIQQHAADVAALISTINLGKVHLVGHSRGGAITVEVAKARPDLIRTLILVDGAIQMPVPETAETRASASFNKKLFAALHENIRSGNQELAAEQFIDTLNGPGSWQKAPDFAKAMVRANLLTALGDKSRPMTTCDDVAKFDFPTLLMRGQNSPKRYEFFYEEMRKCRSFAPSAVIPNASHGMQRQNPKAFNAAVLEFVANH